MHDIIRFILSIISGLLVIYSVLIFIRIVFSWFGGISFGRLYAYLCRITDPYLFWFSRFRIFRTASIDLSPIVALAVLTVANNIISQIAATGRITLGFILSLLVSVVWSALSFVIGFFIVVVLLRLIAYLISANIYSPFWQIIDFLSRPVIFNVNKILFKSRIVNYLSGIITTIVALIALYIGCWFAIKVVLGILALL